METLRSIDSEIVLWLNHGAARFNILADVVKLVANDYFMPVTMSLCLLAAWFMGSDQSRRETNQRAILAALIAVGFANLVVLILNQHYFRERPFMGHELNLLFYRPTDSSFPANPAAVGFAMASAMWMGNRKLGTFLYGVATLWGLARIAAGVFYLSDVVAGALIGIIVSYLVALALRRIEPIPTMVLRSARTWHLA